MATYTQLSHYVAVNIINADQADEYYIQACRTAYSYMTPAQREELKLLIEKGPVWDGDVLSKATRDDLLRLGLASRAVIKKNQGYTVANYHGWDVWMAGR